MGAAYRWLACCALLLTAAQAQSAVELKVIATDPAPDALLARQQPFFVRFELKGAAPATVNVSGLYNGKPVFDDGGTGAPANMSADGIGVVSFFYWSEKPTRIDEVRLHVNDVRGGTVKSEYAFPVALTWLADDPPPREPAAWVKEWQQAQASRQKNPNAAPSGGMTATEISVALAISTALLAVAVAGWRRRRARPAGDDDAGGR